MDAMRLKLEKTAARVRVDGTAETSKRLEAKPVATETLEAQRLSSIQGTRLRVSRVEGQYTNTNCNQALTSGGSGTRPTARLSLPAKMLNPQFAGRDALLLRIQKTLNPPTIPTEPAHLCLCGIPGVGKTQTALAFAQSTVSTQSSSAASYAHQFLVNGQSLASVQNDLVRHAKLVDDPAAASLRKEPELIGWFIAWLKTADRWLLILDDVHDTSAVYGLLPSSGNGHIIYTTRSPQTAKLLCGGTTANVIEMAQMQADESREMLLSVMRDSTCTVSPADTNTAIEEISAFCGGLPLAMGQLVRNADSHGLHWRQALANAKQKRSFLEQKNINGFYAGNLSTGAILISALDQLKSKDRSEMAAALFPVLAYLEPSSISHKMLVDGGTQLSAWFTRTVTYDRGCSRTVEGDRALANARRNRLTAQQLTGAPDAPWYERLRSVPRASVRHRNKPLPRVDPPADIELQNRWQQATAIRDVFESEVHLNKALNFLDDSGLVRNIGNNTFWIHDLFAELTRAYLESMNTSASTGATNVKPPSTSHTAQTTLHLCATLVYLAFPPILPRHPVTTECLMLLPHLEVVLSHLSSSPLSSSSTLSSSASSSSSTTIESTLADATVGAELNYIAGCVTDLKEMRLGISRGAWPGTLDQRRAAASLPYFRVAHAGYAAAAQRVISRLLLDYKPKRVRRMVSEAVSWDFDLENFAQTRGQGRMYYSPVRHAWDCERFGSDPVRRRADSLLKLGLVCRLAGHGDEAVRYLRAAQQDYTLLLGQSHELTEEARVMLQVTYEKAGQWEEVLGVVQERYRVVAFTARSNAGSGWRGPFFGRQSIPQFGLIDCHRPLLDAAATALSHLGRHEQAILFLETLYQLNERQSGKHSKHLIPVAKSLAVVHGRAAQWASCVYWWCVVFGLVFGAVDGEDVVYEGSDGGENEDDRELETRLGDEARDADVHSLLEEEGWWLKDGYLAMQRGMPEELTMWDFALGKWREELCAGGGHPGTSEDALAALVSKIERDLAVWKRRLDLKRRKDREREEREIREVMEEAASRAARSWPADRSSVDVADT
ncbi:uncharacterized protein HMPREF1541_06844 [Cyphellophora europaea CBS 101466]|uniref:NB-ARC domain-containing protein n=1 Tax=Cyphellophora europaea (strain CBS 101466) TaxID=1220924 RepID=W2RR56_CYPE1|nr:uncharacterized protein HMPREF1541_06844 [Cyphellophora europaea CBS 101466]ETN38805.1 hypothetical protein HMPREF1541_06844 [Cyphellophora europaea CBS 101466]